MSLIAPLTPVRWRPLSEAALEALQAGTTLPDGWRRRTDLGVGYVFDGVGLTVFFDAGHEEDGKRWLHLSISRRDKALPRWEDLVRVRGIFIPTHLAAFHVVPRPAQHYDAEARGHVPRGSRVEVMHLWACLDGDPLPDFLRSRGGVL